LGQAGWKVRRTDGRLVQDTVARQIETCASVDALMATNDGETFVAMQRQLPLLALSDPTSPWSQLWFGSYATTLPGRPDGQHWLSSESE
jgi:hypothetical protein